MGDHLIVLHSAVRACAGYNRHEAPSILMDGSSIARDTEHGRTVAAQLHAPSRHARRGDRRRHLRARRRGAVQGHPPPGARGLRGLLLRAARPGSGPRARPGRGGRGRARADARRDVPRAGGPRGARRGRRVRGAQRGVQEPARSRGPAPSHRGRLPARRWCSLHARSTASRRSPSPTSRICRAGPSSSTCGPRPARRACTSRASSRRAG